MKPIPADLSVQNVIPWMAKNCFPPQDDLEESIIADIPDNLLEAREWRLVEEAVESGYLPEEDIQAEFIQLFSDILSRSSSNELRSTDRSLLQAAALGGPSSLWFLGLTLVRAGSASVFTEEQEDLYEDGLQLLVEAAEAGDSRAQWMLGERFSRMKGGLEEGVRLLGMSAAQKSSEAHTRLEELYEKRFTFIGGASERKWLACFAKAGVAEAQFDCASELYLLGKKKEAFAWMLKAAKGGNSLAQHRLSFFYEIGEGCSRDMVRSIYWRDLSEQKVEQEAPLIAEFEAFSDIETLKEPVTEANEGSKTDVVEIADVEPKPEEVSVGSEGVTEISEAAADSGIMPTVQEADLAFEKDLIEPVTTDRPTVTFTARLRGGLALMLRRLADRVSK